MPDLFADTSGWGHLIDQTQCYHSVAATIYRTARQQGRKVITTNYVIAELVTLLASPLHVPRSLTIAFIEGLKTSPYVEVVNVDPNLDDEAWQLLKSARDKEWSLADCASFVIMRHRSIFEALTSDHHFDQAGFIRLLKS